MANYQYFEPPLATGGEKVVYRGICIETGLDVAVKCLRQPYGQRDVQHFAHEIDRARAGAGTGIAQILDFNVNWAPPFYIEEYFPEGTLAKLVEHVIRARRVFPVRTALNCCRQILAQLAGLHGPNIIHRDVKPSNALLRGNDVVLSDMGIGRTLDRPTMLQTQAFRGTPAYAAPEQALVGLAVDHRADLYAVGVILHELLTGKRGAYNYVSFVGDARLVNLVKSLLALNPAHRPASAHHAIGVMDAILAYHP
ncbi:MAG: serine/threonine-protein kinase [Polyangiales bacterium]